MRVFIDGVPYGVAPDGSFSGFGFMDKTDTSASNTLQPNTGTVYYNRFIPSADLKNVTRLQFDIISQSGASTSNIGIYDGDGGLVRSATIVTSGSGDGAILSNTFDPIDLCQCVTYWLAITKVSGGTLQLAGDQSNTGEAFGKQETVQSPYDLPATIGTTSQSNNYYLIGVSGTVAG